VYFRLAGFEQRAETSMDWATRAKVVGCQAARTALRRHKASSPGVIHTRIVMTASDAAIGREKKARKLPSALIIEVMEFSSSISYPFRDKPRRVDNVLMRLQEP